MWGGGGLLGLGGCMFVEGVRGLDVVMFVGGCGDLGAYALLHGEGEGFAAAGVADEAVDAHVL